MDAHTRNACLAGVIAAAFASICAAAPGTDPYDDPATSEAAAPPGGEALNLPDLEDRLRETQAIPALQKVALKSEINALLAKFRQAHAAGGPAVAELRLSYERLMQKIRSLLQRDPRLANDLTASREAIWDVLADRTKFAAVGE